MINNDKEPVENQEVKTPSPLSSPADRSIVDEDENYASSENISASSSLLDLKKRLLDLPSPNETSSRLSAGIAVNRRLSRKRDVYFQFHGAANRIDEKDEREEKEREIQTPGNFEIKDARARRRARISLERLKNENQTMVLSQPNTASSTKSVKEANNENTAKILNNVAETRAQECFQYSGMESPSYSQYSSLSQRTLSPLSPYRKQRFEDNDDSCRLQREAILRAHASLSCDNSPKHRIDLQRISPMSLGSARPMKFGGYRPVPGVILQNLSSGSDQESGNEVQSSRITPMQKVDRTSVSPITFTGTGDGSPIVSNRSNTRNSSPMYTSRSLAASDNSRCRTGDSAGNKQFQTHLSRTVSGEMINDSPNSSARSVGKNLNNLLAAPVASSTSIVCETAEYTPRGNYLGEDGLAYCVSNNNLKRVVNNSPFPSERSEAWRCDQQMISPPSSTSTVRDTSNCQLRNDVPGGEGYGEINFKRHSCETLAEETEQECENISIEENQMTNAAISASNEFLFNSAYSKFQTNETQGVPSGAQFFQQDFHMSNTFSESPNSRVSSREEKAETYSTGNVDFQTFQQMGFNCVMGYGKNSDMRFPSSTRTIDRGPADVALLSPDFKRFKSEGHSVATTPTQLFQEEMMRKYQTNTFSKEFVQSEEHSVASTPKEIFDEEMSKKYQQNMFLKLSTENRPELLNTIDMKDHGDTNTTIVPTLVLNSEDMSYSESPSSKTCTGGQLDANVLIAALSNVSLKRETTNSNDVSSRKYAESWEGSKTVSRPGSCKSNIITNQNPQTPKSLDLEEHNGEYERSRSTHRSSLSTRSKIPVMVSNSRRSSTSAKLIDLENKLSGRQTDLSTPATSIDSSRKLLENTSRLSEESRLNSERKCDVISQNSCENASFNKNDVPMNFTDSVTPVSGISVEKYLANASQNFSETESSCGGTCRLPKDRLMETLSPLPMKMHEKDQEEFKQELQGVTFRTNSSRSKKSHDSCSEDTQNSNTASASNRDTRRSDVSDLNFSDLRKRNDETYDIIDSKDDQCSESFSAGSMNNDNFTPTMENVDTVHSTQLDSYRDTYLKDSYERGNHEAFIEHGPQIESEIGDTAHHSLFIEEPNKLEISEEISRKLENRSPNELFLESPARMEGVSRHIKRNENHEKVRFSVEKLAAEQFRRNLCAEQAKAVLSESAAFLTEKTTHESCSFPVKCSSSMSKLRNTCERSRDSPHFKKKSQDRFPFTISEKTSAVSMKYKSMKENTKSLERTYKLDVHPSITRLAGAGTDDTPGEILNYIAYSGDDENRFRSSGMKGFVKRFSARLRKSKRRREEVKQDMEVTSVIYENRDYRGDSVANSCSESSLLKEFRWYENLVGKRCVARNSIEEKSSISDEKSLNVKSSKATSTSSENPRRKFDRDDLWVQEFKDPVSNDKQEIITVSEAGTNTEMSSPKDPYSLFFVKTPRQTEEAEKLTFPKDDETSCPAERQRNHVKFAGTSLSVISRISKDEVNVLNDQSGDEDMGNERNFQTGCLCLRFYRMISRLTVGSAPKYQSPIKHINSSTKIKRKPRFSLRKRKG